MSDIDNAVLRLYLERATHDIASLREELAETKGRLLAYKQDFEEQMGIAPCKDSEDTIAFKLKNAEVERDYFKAELEKTRSDLFNEAVRIGDCWKVEITALSEELETQRKIQGMKTDEIVSLRTLCRELVEAFKRGLNITGSQTEVRDLLSRANKILEDK